jgi:hypothetical protein
MAAESMAAAAALGICTASTESSHSHQIHTKINALFPSCRFHPDAGNSMTMQHLVCRHDKEQGPMKAGCTIN